MNQSARKKVTTDARDSVIGDLPTEVIHRILELMPIKDAARSSKLSKKWRQMWSTQPQLVFDSQFFQFVSEKSDSVADSDSESFSFGSRKKKDSASSIILRILLQHTGPILEFYLISKGHKLALADIDAYLIFVSKHDIQKITLDLAYNWEYSELSCSIFTCSTLTHLKLSRVFFNFYLRCPELVSLQVEHSAVCLHRYVLTLPMLETLKFTFFPTVKLGNMAFPKLKNLSIISSHTLTIHNFNGNSTFKRITHLCLDGESLMNLEWCSVPKRLDEPLNLQSLKMCDLQIFVKPISCVLCLLWNSPNFYELDIDEVVKVDEKSDQRQTTKLSSYVSNEQNDVDEALREIRTARLGKFKESRREMYFVEVILAHSAKLERMIVEQCKNCNSCECIEHLKELVSYPRASPKAVIKYLLASLKSCHFFFVLLLILSSHLISVYCV